MNNKYRLAVATIVSLVGLCIAFNDVDPKELFYELKIVDVKLVIMAIILLLTLVKTVHFMDTKPLVEILMQMV